MLSYDRCESIGPGKDSALLGPAVSRAPLGLRCGLKDGSVGADAMCVDPQSSAFFSAVFRFLTLHFDPARPWSREYEALSQFLRERGDIQPGRLEWESRAYRRIPMEDVPAIVWNHGIGVAGKLVDLCATGLMIKDLARPPTVPEGGQTTISLRPPGSTLRVDLPCTLIRYPDSSSACVQFRGAPLVLHARNLPSRRSQLPARRPAAGQAGAAQASGVDAEGRPYLEVLPMAADVIPRAA